jgi:hypothetical protein
MDGGSFGQIESRTVEDEEEMQNYGGGGGRLEYQNYPTTSTQFGTDNRQDLLYTNQLIKLLLEEIRSRRVKPQKMEVGPSSAVPFRPYGKRQIVYRQCFFNPISCF